MTRLAKIINNEIVFSDSVNNVVVDDKRIFNPTEQDFRNAGFEDLPTIEHGDDEEVYYVIEDNKIVAKKRKIYVPPTKYSKLKIIENTEKAGIEWSTVEEWMKNTGSLYAKWLAAQELSNDYEGFDQIIALVKAQFPTVDVDEILRQSILN